MKKIVAGLLVLAAVSSMAVAQKAGSAVSKMSGSTQGLFKTDVDNYINLGAWDTVKPETVFGFVGYDTSIGGINFGLSHQFKKFYMAGYFGGALDEFTLSKSVSDTTGGSKVTTKETDSDGSGFFDSAVLFGFGKTAIKASLRYSVTRDDKYKSDTDPVTISNNQLFYVTPAIDFAVKSKLKDWDAIYSGDLAFEVAVDKEFSTSAGKDVFTNDSYNVLYLGGGLSLSKAGKKVSQSVSVGMENKIYLFPKDIKSVISGTDAVLTSQKGKSGYELLLSPSYELTYPASKTLTMKFGVRSPINLTTGVDSKKYNVGGTEVYNTSCESNFDLNTQASFTAAMVYQWKPNLSLNAGVGIYAPEVGISSSVTKTVNSTTGELTHKGSTTKFTLDDTDAYCSWGSGFTFTPAKGIVLDGSYRILANIFGNDFTTDFAQGNGTNLWNNLNKLIIHNIAIELSVKF